MLDSDDAVQLLRYQTFSMLTESNLDIRSAAACAFDNSVYRTSVPAAASVEGNIQALDLMGVESLTAVQEGETIQLYLQMSGDTDCATASFGYFEPDTAMLTLD